MQNVITALKKAPYGFLISTLVALLAGILLFQHAVQDNLLSLITQMGLDTGRASLISALIMATGAALMGSLVGRYKSGAIVGAALIFSWRYVIPFIQTALQPTPDPSGHLEPLDVSALVYRIITIIALALLCAFIGASVGRSLAEVLLDPLLALGRAMRCILTRRKGVGEKISGNRWQVVVQSTGALVFITLVVITATSSSDLFLFSPDVDLHLAPIFTQQARAKVGTVVTDRVGGKSFLVYLPPSYTTPQASTRRYPVLYLLHGAPGGIRDWLVAGKAGESANTLIITHKVSELVLVMPDGNGRPGMTSEWGNSFDHQQLIEDYVSNTVVRYVDQHYRTLADTAHRAIGGLSMGGFGAANIALHHPTIFGSVIALGGYYIAEGAIWGKNAAYQKANSPLETIAHDKAAWKLHFYLGAATSDQPYYTDTLQFARALKKLSIHYTLDIEPGRHGWSVWQTQLYHALTWLHW
ncbi:MAG: hypothetical protein J2P37_05040 [Ktedonobacteraceae bacterium]|nr:hypothetical protein [Ktedonobacteraceae bacterium]MBO0789858.1 hypothetical protein [Ktedonobacteraceae bacterium]